METALCLRFIAHLAVLINGKPAHRMARAGVIAQCHWDYLFFVHYVACFRLFVIWFCSYGISLKTSVHSQCIRDSRHLVKSQNEVPQAKIFTGRVTCVVLPTGINSQHIKSRLDGKQVRQTKSTGHCRQLNIFTMSSFPLHLAQTCHHGDFGLMLQLLFNGID